VTPNPKPQYRPELDGLRAIAVIGVLLYHLDISWVPGGFTGVDVFFVLSGYLITGLLRREMSAGKFRFKDFFLRRLRRLGPALLTVTIFSSVAAIFLLTPRLLVPFANSVWVQPLAIQNMHFMIEGEYFEGSATKLLLHTWSLGVEEQFYLIWPIVVLILTRLKRVWGITALLGLIGASFALNIFLMDISPKASFFLLPARAWELGLGGLLAIFHEREGLAAPKGRCASLVTFTSILGLGASFLWIEESMRFPGWIALLPVLATVGILGSIVHDEGIVKKLLSTRPMVFIGAISYSLYLWHWPVIVGARISGFDISSFWIRLLLLGLSFGLAILAYRFVETPIRHRRIVKSDRLLLLLSGTIGALLIAFSVLIVKTNGLAFRYSEPARSMLTASFNTDGDDRCGFLFRALNPMEPACVTQEVGRDGVLLWGNSHSAMWVGVFNEMGRSNRTRIYLNTRSCRPTVDNDFCGPAIREDLLRYIERKRITDVVLASTWYGGYGVPDNKFEAELMVAVKRLSAMGVRIWLVVGVPQHASLDPEAEFKLNKGDPSFGKFELKEHNESRRLREVHHFEKLRNLFPKHVRVIDPTPAFCPDYYCYGGDQTAWFRDTNHVTSSGAFRAREYFAPIFMEKK